MNAILTALQLEISKLNIKLEHLRNEMDQADANDANAQLRIAQDISKTAAEVNALESFYKKMGGV